MNTPQEFEPLGRPPSVNLSHDHITPKIRVSTAAILSCHSFGYYWQIETWVFSDDPSQKNRQVIHGTVHSNGRDPFNRDDNLRLCCKAEKAHRHIVDNLLTTYAKEEAAERGEGE